VIVQQAEPVVGLFPTYATNLQVPMNTVQEPYVQQVVNKRQTIVEGQPYIAGVEQMNTAQMWAPQPFAA
jgi:hypothetical protein